MEARVQTKRALAAGQARLVGALTFGPVRRGRAGSLGYCMVHSGWVDYEKSFDFNAEAATAGPVLDVMRALAEVMWATAT
jgi:hypothetical protein